LGEGTEPGGGFGRGVEVTIADVGVDEHREGRRGLDVPFAERVDSTCEHARGERWFASSEAYGGGREGHIGGVVGEVKERLGLFEPALAESQVGEQGDGLHPRSRAGVMGHVDRGSQLVLGLRPSTLRNQNTAVVGAAAGEEERTSVGGHEVLGHLAPLRRPVEVTDEVAGGEHVARGEHDGVEPPVLAPEGACHRLVEQGHALGDATDHDLGKPRSASATSSRSASPFSWANSRACAVSECASSGSLAM